MDQGQMELVEQRTPTKRHVNLLASAWRDQERAVKNSFSCGDNDGER